MSSIKIKIWLDKGFSALVVIFSVLTLFPLFFILFHLVKNGMAAFHISMLYTLPKPPPEAGGLLHSLIGSFIIVGIATVLAVPVGIAAGILLAEFQNRWIYCLRILVNSLQGIPSIVVGILAYIWVVKPLGHFSGFSGGVALSIMMLPMVIKATEETIRLLPLSLKEASYALGVGYSRTILKVILPSAAGGILTGVLLGISRIFGETAPLLFTAFGNAFLNVNPLKAMDALPLLIFNYAMSPYESWHQLAWSASLILIVIVLVLNLITRRISYQWKNH